MARLEIKWLGSHGQDLASWRPDDPSRALAWLTIAVGERGRDGANELTLCVGTPEAIVAAHDGLDRVTTQGCMVVSTWSWPDIERAVVGSISRCDLGDWRLSIAELQKYCHYEYQDYDERTALAKVIPVVHGFGSPDVHLPSWDPVDPGEACVRVDLRIGAPRQPHAEQFSLTVATPAGLRAARSTFVLSERATLLLPMFSWVAARLHIEEIVARCRGVDWDECRNKLMRSFVSERE
jgi:hypothetical protein